MPGLVKVEIDLPQPAYDFLEAAARFAKADPGEFVNRYAVKQIVDGVLADAEDICGALWNKEKLAEEYELNQIGTVP